MLLLYLAMLVKSLINSNKLSIGGYFRFPMSTFLTFFLVLALVHWLGSPV